MSVWILYIAAAVGQGLATIANIAGQQVLAELSIHILINIHIACDWFGLEWLIKNYYVFSFLICSTWQGISDLIPHGMHTAVRTWDCGDIWKADSCIYELGSLQFRVILLLLQQLANATERFNEDGIEFAGAALDAVPVGSRVDVNAGRFKMSLIWPEGFMRAVQHTHLR